MWAIDIEANEGQPIYPSGAGLAKIYEYADGCEGYGNAVVVEHGGTTKSLYAHMSDFSAELKNSPGGVWVDQTKVIGYVGHTGDVSRCAYNHLHYEETTNGGFWDSATYPGAFKACAGSSIKSYPSEWGPSSWDGLTGHTHRAFSDCVGIEPEEQQAQTISFGALSDRVYGEGPFAVSATATSGLPVSFTAGPAGICSVSGATVSIGEIGTCTVTAKQAGNADWLAAPDVSQSFNVNPAPTTTTLTADPSGSVDFGQSVAFTATVSVNPPGSGTPTGTVDITEGARTLGDDLPVGDASVSTNRLTPGEHTITATYSGDAHFLASAGEVTQAVTCKTTITKSVAGSITVKRSTCIEPGVTIGGYVTVAQGGALAINDAVVKGGVRAWKAEAILICDSTVRGSVKAGATRGFVIIGDAHQSEGQWCPGNTVGGVVELLSNFNVVDLGSNQIGGSTVVSWTEGDAGLAATAVAANAIRGTLKCLANDPAPGNDGRPNSVRGSRFGQCKAKTF